MAARKGTDNGLLEVEHIALDQGEDVIGDLADYDAGALEAERSFADPVPPEAPAPDTITGRRRVAIIGYTGHREEAPFGDDSWELWGMNNLWKFMPHGEGKYRWDAWFDLHDADTILADDPNAREHLAWMASPQPFPIYMMEGTLAKVAVQLGAKPVAPTSDDAPAEPWWKEKLPSVEIFPAPMLLDKVKTPYFTNTPAWEVALALVCLAGHPGAEIGLWGVDMAVNTEYSRQRPSVEFYLGLAAGAGISITIPEASDLLKAASMYGDVRNPLIARMKFRQKELAAKLNEVRQRAAQIQHELGELSGLEHQLVGAMEQQTYYLSVWGIPDIGDRDHTDDVIMRRAEAVLAGAEG